MAHDRAHRHCCAGLVRLDRVSNLPNHAVRGRQYQILRQRSSGAEVIPRIDNHHDRTRRPSGGGWRIARYGKSGGAKHQANHDGKTAGHARQS
jgi:hypothetical protein